MVPLMEHHCKGYGIELHSHPLKFGRSASEALVPIHAGASLATTQIFSKQALDFAIEEAANQHALQLAQAWIEERG